MSNRPEPGQRCYVNLVGRGKFEGEVVTSGHDYEVRLLDSDEVVTVPNSEVWTAPSSRSTNQRLNLL